jgi:hypothetical protein
MAICWGTTALLALVAGWTGESLAIPDGATAAMLVAYGLTAQVAGWLLISHGIPHVEAGRAGLVLLLQPSLAFVWDILFFSRPTDGMDVAGALLALGAIYLGTARRRREHERRESDGRARPIASWPGRLKAGLPCAEIQFCTGAGGYLPPSLPSFPLLSLPSPRRSTTPSSPASSCTSSSAGAGVLVSRRVKTEDDYLVAGRAGFRS